MSTHNLCFKQKYEKYQIFFFFIWKFSFFGGKIVSIFEYAWFCNEHRPFSRFVNVQGDLNIHWLLMADNSFYRGPADILHCFW